MSMFAMAMGLLLTLCACERTVNAATSATPRDQTKPNIVLMFLDNIGYGDLGCEI